MKHGRKKTLMLRWGAMMVWNFPSLLESTSLLTNILSKDNMGLYRGNGLFIPRKVNKQQTDINFKIETVINLGKVDLLT